MVKKSSRSVVKKLLKVEAAIQTAKKEGKLQVYDRLIKVQRTLLKKLIE